MKRTVLYSELLFCEAGSGALVRTLNHPDRERVSNQQVVRTSPVLHYDETSGEFETENTRYQRATPEQAAVLNQGL